MPDFLFSKQFHFYYEPNPVTDRFPKFFWIFCSPKGLIAASWIICLHITFNLLNAKDEYRLFRKWVTIMEEIPVERRCAVVGWTEEENRKFWEAERKFNQIWNKTTRVVFVIMALMFNMAMFLVKFDVNVYTFVLVQLIQIAQNR